MSIKKFSMILMALVAMSCFKSQQSLAQTEQPRAFTPKIKTPNTKKELINDEKGSSEEVVDKKEPAPPEPRHNRSAERRVRQHGLGIGLGQTFLLGDYADYGQNKITADLLYTYAASYSFDLLVNAHMSEHKDKKERLKTLGLTTSIKARFVEYDNFSPFFLGGLGFYAPQAKREVNGNNKWSSQKVTFGANFGGGADLRLNENYVVGVLGQLHWPFKVQQDSGPDVKGYYFKLLITGMYLF